LVRKILNGITALIVTCMLLFAASLLLPRVAGYGTYAVLTGSMQPQIPQGSVVYTEKVQPGELAEGDVITFRLHGGAVVTHRIDEIDADGDIITKGDANNVTDQGSITHSQVIGRVKFHLPYLGSVIAAIKTRNGILAVTGVLIVLILSVFLPEIAACDKDKKKKD